MMSEEESCSECKMELVQKKWTELLLNWLNICVYCVPPNQEHPIKKLNPNSLIEIINRYVEDICSTDLDRAILCTDDLEPFLRYKYPIFRLRYFFDEEDFPKKMYMMTSMLLYHCCVNSQKGVVTADICQKMSQEEQEMVVIFCERVGEMEITLNNVETAIRDACDKNYSEKQSNQYLSYEASLKSLPKSTLSQLPSSIDSHKSSRKVSTLKFKSSVTVLPSCVTAETSSYSISLQPLSSTSDCTLSSSKFEESDRLPTDDTDATVNYNVKSEKKEIEDDDDDEPVLEDQTPCKPGCACTKCTVTKGPTCGVPGSKIKCDDPNKPKKTMKAIVKWPVIICITSVVVVGTALVTLRWHAPIMDASKRLIKTETTPPPPVVRVIRKSEQTEQPIVTENPKWMYICKERLCTRVSYKKTVEMTTYKSYSRCILSCMGPQLWPHPIGFFIHSNTLVSIATNKLEYKFQTVPTELIRQYIGEAFKLFLGVLAKMEKSYPKRRKHDSDIGLKKMIIQLDVDGDTDPRLRINTDESYNIQTYLVNNSLKIHVSAASYCGIRHGLETLNQVILLDESTGYLITLSEIRLKDAPTYSYRGVMLDTARNYIPTVDIMKTLDAMAVNKLNTFHWRISDSTSFPLFLKQLPELFTHGAYDRKLVYTKDDIEVVVRKGLVRGIRVVLEIALPGPVGRTWSWSSSNTCKKRSDNVTCNNVLCSRLQMDEEFFDILQKLYSFIIDMTGEEDVFHLSDSVFSLVNCYSLIDDRRSFLEQALQRLKRANKGFRPQLPIIWYSPHLWNEHIQGVWDKLGVQLSEWQPNKWIQNLRKYRVIHSTKWDLSCVMKKQRCDRYRSWQSMYAWKSWRNVEAYITEGGEAILWSDFIVPNNLHYHLWPRTAAVAERLWSDLVINQSATPDVYFRLDSHRTRMKFRGLQSQMVWPGWCNVNPKACFDKIEV